MKKALLFFLMSAVQTMIYAFDFSENGIFYSANWANRTAYVSGNNPSSVNGNINIRSSIPINNNGTMEEWKVTAIGDDGLEKCVNMTSITIPTTITNIGYNAFSGCTGLTSVEIPSSVTTIGKGAFFGCSSLKRVTLPNTIREIGDSFFNWCDNLETVNLPDSLESIGMNAFWGCKKITRIILPNNVKSIGNAAFNECDNLEYLYVPASVTECVSNYVYQNPNLCLYLDSPNGTVSGSTLREIIIGPSVHNLNYGFLRCENLQKVVIPYNVETMGNPGYADQQPFYKCNSITHLEINMKTIPSNFNYKPLTELILGDSVRVVGNYAFTGCDKLTEVKLPAKAVSIGINAFAGCSNLEKIEIPYSVASIGEGAFSKCLKLIAVEIPNSMTSIEPNTFYCCIGLSSIKISNTVKSIGESAFAGCPSLTSITIPESVTEIGSNVFGDVYEDKLYTSALTEIYVKNTTPPNINEYTFSDNIQKKATLYVPVGSKNAYKGAPFWSKFTHVQEDSPLKFSVNYDGDGAVVVSNGEEKYSGDIVIPEVVTIDGTEYEVKSIGSEAFRDCKDLTSVIIPNTVTTVEGFAFYGCSALKTVEIPNSVEKINGYAFYKCSELTSITIPDGVSKICRNTFSGCSKLSSINIPSAVTTIESEAFSGCTSLPVEDGVRYADTYVIEAVDRTQESYKVKEGTRFVGERAFWYCQMTSISLPTSIEYIGENAFTGCTSLPVEGGIRYADTYVIEAVDKEQERYEIKEGTIFIREKAFLECNMTSVSVPNTVKYIGIEAFKSCGKMQSINLPDGITYIGPCAFYGDSALASVNIPKTLTSLSREMFRDCKSLTSIEIPNSITGLGEQSSESSVFWGCSNLISVIIPESVTIIDHGTFSECTSLKEITLPKNLYRIGFHAFWGCTGLESIVVPDSVESIDGTAFYGCTNMKSATIPHSTSGVNGYISNSVFKDTPTLTDLYINVHNLSVNQYSYLREVPEGLTLHYLVGGKAVGSTLVIPDSVQTLGSNIFHNCTEITSIIVNSSTISGRTAFEGCSNVTNFYLLDKQPKSFMGGYMWQNLFNNENVTLYVTQGNLEKVRNEDLYPWSRFKEIIELHKQQEDVNGDEKMNTADVVAVYSHIVNGNESGIKSCYADANLDGIVNTADVVAIYNAIINGVGSDSVSPKFLHNNYPQDNTEE